MAIVVECAQCKTKSEIPNAGTDAKGKCRVCGAVLRIPGLPRKVCASCGIDVASVKRWKDDAARYFCDACWQLHALPGEPAKSPRASVAIGLPAKCDGCGAEHPVTYLTKWAGKISVLAAIPNGASTARKPRRRSLKGDFR